MISMTKTVVSNKKLSKKIEDVNSPLLLKMNMFQAKSLLGGQVVSFSLIFIIR